MFGLLSSSSQIYGQQQAEEHPKTIRTTSERTFNTSRINRNKAKSNYYSKHLRTTSRVSDSIRETFSSIGAVQQSIKAQSNFIEKFIKSELVNNSYDTIKLFKSSGGRSSLPFKTNLSPIHQSESQNSRSSYQQHNYSYPTGVLNSFNCLLGSNRSTCEGEFYEAVHANKQNIDYHTYKIKSPPNNDMTVKCSKNLLTESQHHHSPAKLQNYQKLPDSEINGQLPNYVVASGARSGEIKWKKSDANNSSLSSGSISLYKKLSLVSGAGTDEDRKVSIGGQTQLNASDNSSKSNDLQRSSSATSSGYCNTSYFDCKKASKMELNMERAVNTGVAKLLSPEWVQRHKLMQMISNFDQQNKLLQLELVKEKRRRTEELACVLKSLICFESKLKTDMKTVNQRLQEKDSEICRLVMQNRALRRKFKNTQKLFDVDQQRNEGGVKSEIVMDICAIRRINSQAESNDENNEVDYDDEDCHIPEALQCINCRKQFYGIDLNESWAETNKGKRTNDYPTTEHGSSSDDTFSSSFCGARRSVRYTSKRTTGTFREYMHSRSMNIDDPSLDNNSEEIASTISREDSQTSYEKMNFVYSRLMERMHGIHSDIEREFDQSDVTGAAAARSCSRLSNKSSVSSRTSSKKASNPQIDEDDGIISPTLDDVFEVEAHDESSERELKIVRRKPTEFSEATPKQVYETSTNDWYASASDQEEITSATPSASKSYGHGAVNPVLECVNQILLQQSMEESTAMDISTNLSNETNVHKKSNGKKNRNNDFVSSEKMNSHLPQRSSLIGRRGSSFRCNNHSSEGQQISSRAVTMTRKRVHFSTKNSMVHVPRNDVEDDVDENCINDDLDNNNPENVERSATLYHPMNYYHTQTQIPTATSKGLVEITAEAFNYESIYSNEYEPIIGSEHNGSNFYVDMESSTKISSSEDGKISKIPPELPPKPANLLKFKKSLQQLDEITDEHNQNALSSTTAQSEPDYCSISEVNMNITSVQIVAEVHHKAESETDADIESQLLEESSEIGVEVSTFVSDDTKTDEIDEIFDIPKLPNVAAIITPKMAKYAPTQQIQAINDDYLVMSPKEKRPIVKTQSARKLILNNPRPLKLLTHSPSPHSVQQQHKRKHVPNILAEINKRMSLPNTSTTTKTPLNSNKTTKAKALFRNLDGTPITGNTNLPLQAEFDWYNLDAEYGKAPNNPPDLLKVNDGVSGGCSSVNVLAEISEDHESIANTADEYNLDEEFSLASEKPMDLMIGEQMDLADEETNISQLEVKSDLNLNIRESVNFPLLIESSLVVHPPEVGNTKSKKIKKNLANFEKFIEGSGLSTKQLPNKRKIYFPGPFV